MKYQILCAVVHILSFIHCIDEINDNGKDGSYIRVLIGKLDQDQEVAIDNSTTVPRKLKAEVINTHKYEGIKPTSLITTEECNITSHNATEKPANEFRKLKLVNATENLKEIKNMRNYVYIRNNKTIYDITTALSNNTVKDPNKQKLNVSLKNLNQSQIPPKVLDILSNLHQHGEVNENSKMKIIIRKVDLDPQSVRNKTINSMNNYVDSKLDNNTNTNKDIKKNIPNITLKNHQNSEQHLKPTQRQYRRFNSPIKEFQSEDVPLYLTSANPIYSNDNIYPYKPNEVIKPIEFKTLPNTDEDAKLHFGLPQNQVPEEAKLPHAGQLEPDIVYITGDESAFVSDTNHKPDKKKRDSHFYLTLLKKLAKEIHEEELKIMNETENNRNLPEEMLEPEIIIITTKNKLIPNSNNIVHKVNDLPSTENPEELIPQNNTEDPKTESTYENTELQDLKHNESKTDSDESNNDEAEITTEPEQEYVKTTTDNIKVIKTKFRKLSEKVTNKNYETTTLSTTVSLPEEAPHIITPKNKPLTRHAPKHFELIRTDEKFIALTLHEDARRLNEEEINIDPTQYQMSPEHLGARERSHSLILEKLLLQTKLKNLDYSIEQEINRKLVHYSLSNNNENNAYIDTDYPFDVEDKNNYTRRFGTNNFMGFPYIDKSMKHHRSQKPYKTNRQEKFFKGTRLDSNDHGSNLRQRQTYRI